jgi:hypothetical protein
MPFELGMTVGIDDPGHSWIVCESKAHRVKKSLSDIDGTDAYIHDGTVRGIFRELCSAFARNRRQPTVAEMMRIYRILRSNFRPILRAAGQKNPFNARVFRDLCVLAGAASDRVVAKQRSKRKSLSAISLAFKNVELLTATPRPTPDKPAPAQSARCPVPAPVRAQPRTNWFRSSVPRGNRRFQL